jgi:hypothetical protein
MSDRTDLDPAPPHSPRLLGSCEDVRGRDRGEFRGVKLSEWRRMRLRRIAVIVKCRAGENPVPYRTLSVILGISERQIIRLSKLGKNRDLRSSHV